MKIILIFFVVLSSFYNALGQDKSFYIPDSTDIEIYTLLDTVNGKSEIQIFIENGDNYKVFKCLKYKYTYLNDRSSENFIIKSIEKEYDTYGDIIGYPKYLFQNGGSFYFNGTYFVLDDNKTKPRNFYFLER
ncbi:MAG: hypothetical protein H6589_00820 [Flavobacteriales bacterium]|nr:hypothetical protein [Flavobacteriales bacterium]